MADISKIQIESGTYNIKDVVSRDKLDKVNYVFNTVNDMINSSLIESGNIVKTLGFYSYDDKGGALYKVRSLEQNETANEMSLITLDNGLVAELIKIKVSVNQYGAKGDDTNDDTLAIQTAIDENLNVYFENGIYKTTNSINITNSNTKLYGNGNTSTVIRKYGNTTYTGSVTYNESTFDYGSNPAVINLIFTTNTNISNVEINNMCIYSDTQGANIGISAMHISYCKFNGLRIQRASTGFMFNGWVNKLINCEILEATDNSITSSLESISNMIIGCHCKNIGTRNATGLAIISSYFDNGNPCYNIIDSKSVNIISCNTETNRQVLINTNSYVNIIGGDIEGHSSSPDNFMGFFTNQSNGITNVENADIRFADYYNYGSPTDTTLVKVNTGTITLKNNKIDLPYTYTTYMAGAGGTINIDDVTKTSNVNIYNKTGKISITDGTKVEVYRLPFAYGKNYMINLKSYATFPYHSAINLETQLVACSNGGSTVFSPNVNYTKASTSGTFNSYVSMERDSNTDELVIYYNSTNAYGSAVYFDIEYVSN